MTESEMIQRLTAWQDRCLALGQRWDEFSASTGAGMDSPLGKAVWQMVDAYTAAVAELVGAPPSGLLEFTNDLTWYAYENDFGRRGNEAGVREDMRPIRTPADLAWLILLGRGDARA